MKQLIDVYVHIRLEGFLKGDVALFECDMSDYGYHLLSIQKMEFDIPEFDLVKIEIDGIDKEIVKLRADAQEKIIILQNRKQELLAIGVDE